jgi:hypothetical protein
MIGTGVDHDLHHAEELGMQQQINARQRAERQHQEQRARDRVLVQAPRAAT